ncbi:MAG TPA: hypothetical protein VIG47_06965 [Gemmatimonadaceae bacterium]
MLNRFWQRTGRRRKLTICSTGTLLVLLLLPACWKLTVPFSDDGKLISIAISGNTSVQTSDTIRLSASGKVTGVIGIFTYDRVLDAVWSVSDPRIAGIVPVKLAAGDSTSGSAIILTGLRLGNVQVTATARGVQASVNVTVTAAP